MQLLRQYYTEAEDNFVDGTTNAILTKGVAAVGCSVSNTASETARP